MHLRERFGLHVFALDESFGLQEVVNLLGHGCHTGCAHTVSVEHFGAGLCSLEVTHAGVESAAAESAEGHDFLAAEIDLLEQGDDRRSIGSEPHWIAQEDHVVGCQVGYQGLDFRQGAAFALLHAAPYRCLKIPVVGVHGHDFFDVGASLGCDFLGDGLGVRSLGIIKHKSLGGLFLAAGNGSKYGKH